MNGYDWQVDRYTGKTDTQTAMDGQTHTNGLSQLSRNANRQTGRETEAHAYNIITKLQQSN